MKKIKLIPIIMICITMLFGCGNSSSMPYDDYMLSDNYSSMGFSESKDMFTVDNSSSMTIDSYETTQSESIMSNSDENTINGAKLIRDVYIDIQTTDLDKIVEEMKTRTNKFGGYIQNIQVYNYTNRRDYNLDIRVPYSQVDLFLEGIEDYGVINNISDNTKDITLTYAGIETRLENLNIQHKRLLELLDNAESLTDVIALEERLSEVETELDTYTLEIKNYDNLINYSTISMSISEYDYVFSNVDRSVFGRIKSGMSDNLYELKEDFQNIFIWFIVHIPNIIIFIVICSLTIFVVKKCKKKIKIKKKIDKKTE